LASTHGCGVELLAAGGSGVSLATELHVSLSLIYWLQLIGCGLRSGAVVSQLDCIGGCTGLLYCFRRGLLCLLRSNLHLGLGQIVCRGSGAVVNDWRSTTTEDSLQTTGFSVD